jgi:hypothetical protein
VLGVVSSGITFNLIHSVLTNQTVNDRKLVIRRIAAGDLEAIRQCSMLYCESLAYLKSPDLLASLAGQPVLTVSPDARFLERNGIVQMRFRDGRLTLAIHLPRARAAGFQMSSKLLSVSEVVEDAP